jgi:predicted nucleic acid-binding Zn finger protein
LGVFGGEESCSCPDFRRRHDTCKHLAAATVARAKARMRARAVQAERTAARASGSSLASLAASL